MVDPSDTGLDESEAPASGGLGGVVDLKVGFTGIGIAFAGLRTSNIGPSSMPPSSRSDSLRASTRLKPCGAFERDARRVKIADSICSNMRRLLFSGLETVSPSVPVNVPWVY